MIPTLILQAPKDIIKVHPGSTNGLPQHSPFVKKKALLPTVNLKLPRKGWPVIVLDSVSSCFYGIVCFFFSSRSLKRSRGKYFL